MDKNQKTQKALEKLLPLVEGEQYYLKTEEFVIAFKAIAETIKTLRNENQAVTDSVISQVDSLVSDIVSNNKDLNVVVQTTTKESKKLQAEFNKSVKAFRKDFESFKQSIKDGEDGIDADEERIVQDVLAKIELPKYKETILDGRQEIVEKINTGKKSALKIEANQIEGIDKFTTQESLDRAIAILDTRSQYLINKTVKVDGTTITGNGTDSSPLVAVSTGSALTVQDIDGTPTATNVNTIKFTINTIKFTNGAVTDDGAGVVTVTTGAGGGGDVSSNTALSVDSEIALFSGTGGKTIKRATGTGIATLTAGVLSATATTGTGSVVLATSPTLVTPALGTPASGVATNLTGTAAGLTAGNVTTNANLTGPVTSTGNATAIANGAISNAMLANGAVANLTGTNSGDNATNTQYSGLVSNATHTGDATGATALTVVRINGTSLAGLATGLLKNTTTTGVPSIAVNSDLPVMSATVGGAVPTPPNNTTTFLRGDGTFAAPSSGFADPLTTNGDIIARISGSTTRLAQGANGTFLGVSGGALGYYTPAGSGDMVLATAQTNTGAKTFNNATLLMRNVADTFSSQFTNTNTAARTYTLKDAAGTIAFTSDITGTNSGTNTGDNTVSTSGAATTAVTLLRYCYSYRRSTFCYRNNRYRKCGTRYLSYPCNPRSWYTCFRSNDKRHWTSSFNRSHW